MKLADIMVTPLSRFETAGGDVLHAMKKTDNGYAGYGEAYFSWIAHGAIKAWKCHTQMTMNVIVPVGQVRFVFQGMDDHGIEAFRVEDIGEDNYVRLTVPPGIWFGFQGLKQPHSLVLNIASIPHDPSEVKRSLQSAINYIWN